MTLIAMRKKPEEENRYLCSHHHVLTAVSRSALCDFTRKSRIIPRKFVLRAEKMHQNDDDDFAFRHFFPIFPLFKVIKYIYHSQTTDK